MTQPWLSEPARDLPIDGTVRLTDPPEPAGDHPRRYGIGTFFQVSATQVALLANRRVTNVAVVDHEDGWDTFIFNRLDGLKQAQPVVGGRNITEQHPATGEPVDMVHHLPIGGFVPLGARLADGSAHPHAGTGFAMGFTVAHPTDHRHAVPLSHGPSHVRHTMHQYRFDGRQLETDVVQFLGPDFFPGWVLGHRGLSPAIPDGTDLLFAINAGRPDDPAAREHVARARALGKKPLGHPEHGPYSGCCVARWRYGVGGWKPVEIHRVVEPGPDLAFEPTLVRDVDGSLLCSVRSKGADGVAPGEKDALGVENLYQALRVYRSTDGARTWKRVLCLPVARSASPVTINAGPDGQPYLMANPTVPLETDSRGRTVPMVFQRQRLWAWPLSADRTTVAAPERVLDAVRRFGPPRPLQSHACDNRWMLDHPLGLNVRLADGKHYHMICYRVSDSATNSGGATAAPESGLYVHTLSTPVTCRSVWNF